MDKMTKIAKWGIAAAMMAIPFMSLAVVPVPALPAGSELTLTGIEDIIKLIATTLMVAGITIAIIFIIWGGIKYMTAGGDEKRSGAAKTAIFNGIIGAAVVIGVGVILRTVAGLITRNFFGGIGG